MNYHDWEEAEGIAPSGYDATDQKEMEIFFIRNTVNEWNTKISGYFFTLEAAKEALKNCCDWYRPNGTGKIYAIRPGLNQRPRLVYEAK